MPKQVMCEWNPDLNREAKLGDMHPIFHPAKRRILIKGEWYALCLRCLDLPRFKYYQEQESL